MEFGIEKCAMLVMKSGKRQLTDRMELPNRIKLKECEKKDKYLDLARELKKPRNMKVTIAPIVIGSLGPITKGLLKGLEESIAENGQNPETSPRNLRRLAVSQTQVKNLLLTLMCKKL